MDLRLPEEIWLAGKGPSFDFYDWSASGEIRIGLNETAFLIPDCWGAFAKDFPIVERYISEPLNPSVTVFIKDTWPEKYHIFQRMFLWNRPIHANILFGTAVTSLQIFHTLGARTFHMVGFDSIDAKASTYAQKIKAIDGEGKNQDGYEQINIRMKQVITSLGIKPIWEHRQMHF